MSGISKTDTGDTARADKPRWRLRLHDVFFGSVMLASGGFLLAALLSHNVLDPSWNVAAEGQVSNWMGPWGAAISDGLLQALGWAAGGPAIALLIWGGILIWRLPRVRTRSVAGFRWFFAAIATAAFAAAVSALPVPNAWPYASGLGGALGDIFLNALAALPDRFDLPAAQGLAAAFGLLVAIGGIFFTFGLRSRDLTAAVDAAGLIWATLRVWADSLRGRAMALGGNRDHDLSTPAKPTAAKLAARPAAVWI